MFKSLIFFSRIYVFWLIFFAIDKFIFLFIFHQKLRNIPIGEKLVTFYHALRLDLSMTAYIAVITLIIFCYWYLKNKPSIEFNWVTIYHKSLIVIFSTLTVINFNIYREWGNKVNSKVFSFVLDTPNEAIASSSSSPILLSLMVFFVMIITGFYLEFMIVKKRVNFMLTPIWLKSIIVILILGLNFLCIRGGFGVAPNNQSMAYFSNYQILNHASLNTEWNLMSSILAASKTNKNPYVYFDEHKADEQIKKLYNVEKDSNLSVLKTERPNVVMVILESFTANLTKTLGNEVGISPNFDRLIDKGILFTKIYATGNRTDKGLIGTLTGFPTLGSGSIVKWPEKMQKIPAISQKLYNAGYQTSFFYGGESEFDNYKAFILGHSYLKLIDKNSFAQKDMNSKWGAYDAEVFSRQLKELNQSSQPFFSTILTLTNHEPFEVPGRAKFGIKDISSKFKSTAYYTDSCVNAYLNEAKKQDWYKNTLFIFIADHGHRLPKNKYEIFEPERYHIPLLFYGDVIKDEFKGKKFNQVGSQQDVSSTLLAQLKIPAKDFIWSNNLLNPYRKNFAFFTWDNGLGFIKENQIVTFDPIGNTILYQSNPKNSNQSAQTLNLGKAYLQTVYQQFIKL